MGAFMIFIGILTLTVHDLTLVLCGIGVLLYGVGSIVNWISMRRCGAAGIFGLIVACLSVVFGIFIFIGDNLGEFALRYVILVFSIYLMGSGVLDVIGAVMYRKAMTSVDLGVQAPGSIPSMVGGAVMVAIGVLAILFPIFGLFVGGLVIVVGMFVIGARFIWMARTVDVLEASD